MNNHGYNVCFLDILGFSKKITKDGGLEMIKDKYLKLAESIRLINDRYNEVISKGILEGSYWAGSDDIGVFYKINVLYGSDSIIIWSDRTWERFKTVEDISKIHPASLWESFPKVCDPFIQICNEIICKSIELDLPLRGALSVGDAYFDFDKYIVIGKPIVEAAYLEGLQNLVGASFCLSFENQIIPKKFYFKFDNYTKSEFKGKEVNIGNYTNQNVLDWPRHWRETRKEDLYTAIEKLDFDSREDIKENTLRLVKESEIYKDKFISKSESSIMSVYKDYYLECGLPIRLIWKQDRWTFGDVNELNKFCAR